MTAPKRRITTNLDQLAVAAGKRVEKAMERQDLASMATAAAEVLARDRRRNLLSALAGGQRQKAPRLIAEVKRGSPAAGVFGLAADAAALARHYAAGGAAAISLVTEQDHFRGDPADLARVRQAVNLPVLQKDFIVHPYQVYEAVTLGADGILLIAAILSDNQLRQLLTLARSQNLTALVEVNTAAETARAVAAGARLIGINNRNLRTFDVDLATTEELMPHIPADVTVVGASGVRDEAGAARLAAAGVDALLVGEALVRSGDPRGMVKSLRMAAAGAAELWVKICGLGDTAGGQTAALAGADAVGFIFAPSPRRVTAADAAQIAAVLPANMGRVGVFVGRPADEIRPIVREVGLTHVQLHGQDAPEVAAQLQAEDLKIIQALQVRNEASVAAAHSSPADKVLLDAYDPELAGGTGRTFQWSLAAPLASQRPVLLAGGLHPGNVAAAVQAVGPYGVDVASGVETAPGRKDPQRVLDFVRAARQAAGLRAVGGLSGKEGA